MDEAGDKLSGEKDSEKKSPQHQRGDKRRRSSSSPDRSQVKRSRSPIQIKEDEPVIDSDKVQLSWCKYGSEDKLSVCCLNHKIGSQSEWVFLQLILTCIYKLIRSLSCQVSHIMRVDLDMLGLECEPHTELEQERYNAIIL